MPEIKPEKLVDPKIAVRVADEFREIINRELRGVPDPPLPSIFTAQVLALVGMFNTMREIVGEHTANLELPLSMRVMELAARDFLQITQKTTPWPKE